MAGTLLLISKDKKNTKQFLSKIEQLKNYTKDIFGEYFNYIIFHNLNQTSFLIEFRQDKREKFYKDVKGNWLIFEGVVFALHKTICYAAEDLWNLYKDSNSVDNFANELDGHFVIKIYDAQKESYLIINDYIKNKTNFICETKNFIMFTPLLITTGIIKKTELDLYAFNEFMWRYYILSERSILKDVQRLTPASIYTIKNGKMQKKTYWEWPDQYTKLSFQESVTKMVASMKETARLITKSFGKPCIDFTMGQDSRQIISAFTNQNLPFSTAIFGKENFFEVKQVKEMAQRHNIENHNIQLQKDYYDKIWDVFKKAIILGSCEQPGYLLGRILNMRYQFRNYGNAGLNGMDGHFYKNGLWDEMFTFNFYREPKKFNINNFLKFRVLSKNYFGEIFSLQFLQIKNNSKAYFTNLVKKSIKNYLESPVSIQVDKFDLYHWLNFGIAGNNACNEFFPSLSPLLLRRNLEFALKVPVQWKFNLSKFQRAVVCYLDPELAREKTDFGGVNMMNKNLFTYIPFYFRYFNYQSKRLKDKIKSKLGFKVVTHLQKAWDYLPIYKLLFQDENFQRNLIYENMYLSEIIKEDEWNKFIKKFQESKFQTMNNFEYLFKIVSVEHFMRKANNL